MASPQAILRAAKAVPGARPTPPPQGANIGIGRISPLAWDLSEDAGYARAYAPFMPRPARTFTSGAFGPFSPILPVPVDEPPPGGQLPDPRRFDYPVGWNLPTIPGQDGFRMASFAVLDTVSRLYSVARTCIERRKAAIVGMDWDIVPTREASKAYQGSHSAMRDFGKRRAKAVAFFNQPDRDFDDFGGFLSALLEQVFVNDAMSLLLKPVRGRGLRKGVLGSDLDCLGLVDGSTIRPLLSLSGGRPRPPAPAWQQFLKGVPRSDISAMLSGQDIEDAGLTAYAGPAFRTDQMIYRPVVPRVNSPYGFSMVEMALLVIMTGLRKQAYQAQYYDEGTVPAVYLSPGDTSITPSQIRELQDALNGFAGDPAWHHKIIVTPPGTTIHPMRPSQLADQFDEVIMSQVAMVFDVDPISLGLVPNVSSTVSPFAAREMAQASRTVHERTSTKPLLKYLCSIFNAILHRVLGQDDMKFTFAGMDEAADQAAVTDLLVKQVQNGIRSVDEAREELELTPWGLPETSGPVVFTQAGVMPFEWVPGMAVAQAEGASGPYSGETAPSTKPGGPHGDTRPLGVHHPPSSRPWTGSRDLQHIRPDRPPSRAPVPSGAGRTGHTPAHSAAEGHTAVSRQDGRAKAVRSELEALSRHLRKGRAVSTWEPRHLSGQVMAVIAEDLTKGLGADEVIRGAMTVALPRGEYERSDKPEGAAVPGHERRIAGAFEDAAAHAGRLVAQARSGELALPVPELAAKILSVLRASLGPVLRGVHRDAWAAGKDEAASALRITSAGDEQEREAWIASQGRDWLEAVCRTAGPELTRLLAAPGPVTEDAVAAVLGAGQRPALIACTETARARNAAALSVMQHAGVQRKRWLPDGGSVCAACRANAEQGAIPLAAPFSSGDVAGPAHPGCSCGVAAGPRDAAKLARRAADLNGEVWWPQGSYPSGPAAGGGGRMVPAHDADGTEYLVPGGVPGMTAGGEPPRQDGDGPGPVTEDAPGTVSAGRGDVHTLGGGTAGLYRDLSDRTHAGSPDSADDAAWPGTRGIPPGRDASWPLQGYMGGYWPQGGHGTGQSPGTSAGSADRGRAPGAHGKAASGYDLSRRSGMISLDLPAGLVRPVPGGVSDHHVTICYLGNDVTDEQFALACLRASAAAALMPGPLCGVISGRGTFEPSASSDGKVPVWAGVMLPGAEILREALADLSASEFSRWLPHVTLAYLDPADPLPDPVTPVPVTFTHISVHRGGDVERFELGVPLTQRALAGAAA